MAPQNELRHNMQSCTYVGSEFGGLLVFFVTRVLATSRRVAPTDGWRPQTERRRVCGWNFSSYHREILCFYHHRSPRTSQPVTGTGPVPIFRNFSQAFPHRIIMYVIDLPHKLFPIPIIPVVPATVLPEPVFRFFKPGFQVN